MKNKREYAFFIGCTVPVRALNYELSTRKVADKLGVRLVDVPEFNCCGFPMDQVSRETALTMALNVLAAAEERHLDVCTICNACGVFLREANLVYREDKAMRGRLKESLKVAVGREYHGTVEVRHFARILYEDVGLGKIRESVVKPMADVKVAAYPGCHFYKPSKVHKKFDDPEMPKILEELVEAAGASPVDYDAKRQCCGGAVLGVNESLSLALSNKTLASIKKSGADLMTLICPFCDVMYELNQKKIESTFNASYGIPVLYYTQLLGLALGFAPDEVGLSMNRVKFDLEKVLNKN